MVLYTAANAMSSFDSGVTSPVGSKQTRRETLLKDLAYVNVIQNPLLARFNTFATDNTLVEWVMDSIDDPRPTGVKTIADIDATLENAEFDPAQPANRIRIGNYSHIMAKAFRVTDTQRLMNEVAIGDEYDHQVWRNSLALLNLAEFNVIWSQGAVGSEAAVRTMHGLLEFASNASVAGFSFGGLLCPSPFLSTWVAGTNNNLTPAQLYDDLLSPFWQKGNNIDGCLAVVGAKLKRIISQFAMVYSGSGATLNASPLNERQINAADKKIIEGIDIFQTDVGPLNVNTHQYMTGSFSFSDMGPSGGAVTADDTMLVFDPSFFDVGVIQGPHVIPLARVGLTSQAAIAMQITLTCRNPRAIAGGTDLTS